MTNFGWNEQPFPGIRVVKISNAGKGCSFWRHFGGHAQPFPGIGVVKISNAGKGCSFWRHFGGHAQPLLTRAWRGRTQKLEVKLHILATFWRTRATFPRDWRGRMQKREVKLHILATFWRTRATLTYQGLAWSNAITRGKVAHFDDILGERSNPSQGFAWSNAGTRGTIATFRCPAQPLPGFGVVKRPNAR